MTKKFRMNFLQSCWKCRTKNRGKTKRVWGSIYQVPQEVKEKRKLFLASKRIISSARSRKWTNFAKRLASELIDAANETWNAYKKKLDVYKMAEANKAFARFAKFSKR